MYPEALEDREFPEQEQALGAAEAGAAERLLLQQTIFRTHLLINLLAALLVRASEQSTRLALELLALSLSFQCSPRICNKGKICLKVLYILFSQSPDFLANPELPEPRVIQD